MVKLEIYAGQIYAALIGAGIDDIEHGNKEQLEATADVAIAAAKILIAKL